MKLISTAIALLAAATPLSEEWLGKRWRTEPPLTTYTNSRVHWHGFPGIHDIMLADDPKTASRFSVSIREPSGTATIPHP